MTVRGDDNDNCFMDTAWYYSSYCYPASFSITAQIDLNKKGFDLKVRYMFFDIYPRKPKKKKQKRSKKAELPEDSFLMILRSLRTILKKAYLSHRLMIRLIKQEKCPSKLLKLSLKK